MTSSAPRALARALRLSDLVFIVVGTVIGSGIFLVPGPVLRDVGGRVGVALGVWLAAGVLSLLGALTYAELSALDPESGGLYAYLRDAFGPFTAFLYGWTLFFVISSGSVATLAVAFSVYLGQFVTLSAVAGKAVAVTMIAVVAAVNVRGTRHGAEVQNWSTLLKAGAILVMSVALIAVPARNEITPAAAPAAPSLVPGIGLAMVAVLWAYEGWQYVTFCAGETEDPQRVFPRGLLIGTVALIAIYLIANLGYLAALGPAGVAGADRVAAAAVAARLGPGAAKVIAAAILVSMFSAANGLTLTAPRAYYAMARDGLFFRRLSEVHPRFGTPAFAVIAGSLWAMVLAASGTFEQLLTYVVFTGWIFYALGAASIFASRRRSPGRARPFRVPGYPWTPSLFIAASAAIVVNTLIAQPARAAVGLAIVFVGTPAYFIWRRAGK